MKSRHASGDDLGMPHCYASIPPLMLLSVIDLSLQRTPRSISSTSEWTLQHEQWARKPLNNAYWCSQGTKYSKKMTYGGGTRLQHVLFFVFFPSLCWIFYNLFLHVMEFFFFLWPEAHQAWGLGGEMESRLPAWMQNCFGKPRQTFSSLIVPTDSLGQYMKRRFCQEAAFAFSMMAWMKTAL